VGVLLAKKEAPRSAHKLGNGEGTARLTSQSVFGGKKRKKNNRHLKPPSPKDWIVVLARENKKRIKTPAGNREGCFLSFHIRLTFQEGGEVGGAG